MTKALLTKLTTRRLWDVLLQDGNPGEKFALKSAGKLNPTY
jgi:hypothetical protein